MRPAPTSLRTVQWEARPPIQLDLNLDVPEAAPPFVEGDPSDVRLLTPAECESLSAAHSSLAALLTSAGFDAAATCERSPLHSAFACQAAFERNQSSGDALIAYYRLASVYLQFGLSVHSLNELKRFEDLVQRLETQGVARSMEHQGAINQSRLDVLQKQAQLEYSQRVLTAQLREMLDLDPAQLSPIWTDFEATPSLVSNGVTAEIEIALAHRGDLQALEHLQSLSPRDLLGLNSGWATSIHPLLGFAAGVPVRPWQLLFCKHRTALENAWCQQQRQLTELIITKRRAISVEVEEVWYSLEKRQRTIELKQRALASLDADWNARLAAKDILPVTVASETDYSNRRLVLTSELLQERIELEIDLVRLQKAQGTLGTRAAGGHFQYR